ncbi:MAG: hypothetical protein GC171_07145 [Terrimonas sp.]|nr:hypothetical protein [Terrimonas sp.]
MKPTRNFFFSLIALALMNLSAYTQNSSGVDSTGLPGDNFSLQGALQMFQKAGSPEEFEKLINTENNNVNNLDLNGDGETDYIRVIDQSDKDVHVFVLQVPVSENESQDIAVIELEKTGDASAMIQIIGDEDIYGEEVIVEPDGGDAVDNDSKGPYLQAAPFTPERLVVNVWFWPSVRYVYGPVYRPWISPFRWRVYPNWWQPWRPYAWHIWHPRCRVYHRSFAVVHTHRVIRAHTLYKPVRVSSVTVRSRNAVAMNNYRVTRTRTTVTGPRGNKAVKTTTTVQGRGGKVKAKKTTVRRKRG